MKQLFKTLIMIALTSLMLFTFTNAQDNKKDVKVLVFGNSVLMHAPADQLGWTGTWGMAASSEDKDYFHVMQRELQSRNPDVNFSFVKKSINFFKKSMLLC